MIAEQYFIYDFTGLHFAAPKDGMCYRDGFALRLKLNAFPKSDAVLFEIPGSFKVAMRDIPSDEKEGAWERAENFRSLLSDDGHCFVVEIDIAVEEPDHPDWQSMKIGVPMALLGKDWQRRDIVMAYTKMRLQIFVDGELVNENLPVGWLKEPTGCMLVADELLLADVQVATDVSNIQRTEHERTHQGGLQYYLPHGFNTWAGDVVLFFHDGVFHLIYFLDRHHHYNRWGMGAHHFQQLTSTNLVDWTDHGPLFELDEPWQSVGTGTMFFHRGKYYFTHGWHTGRVVPHERTASVFMAKYYSDHGTMRPFDKDDLVGMTLSGATYAVSDDGIHFAKVPKVFNTAENPSIYTNPDDSLTMYCGSGTWMAKDIDSDWMKVDPDFPKYGPDMPMRNSNECPSFFNWNGFRYLIMGLTGFWIAKGDGEFVDSAANGYDIYDGLAVPMVAPFNGNRMILGGWLNGIGWGSCIVLRELIQYPDGRLGMKWLEELAPKTGKTLHSIADSTVTSDKPLEMTFARGQSVYVEMQVHALTEGRMAMRLLDAENAERSCELQLDFGRQRMQISPCVDGGFHPEIQTIREGLRNLPQDGVAWKVKASHGIHAGSRDFCLEHVDVLTGVFTLKMVVWHSQKMRCTIVDVEVAGQRTLISNRVRLTASSLVLVADSQPVAFEKIEMREYLHP